MHEGGTPGHNQRIPGRTGHDETGHPVTRCDRESSRVLHMNRGAVTTVLIPVGIIQDNLTNRFQKKVNKKMVSSTGTAMGMPGNTIKKSPWSPLAKGRERPRI